MADVICYVLENEFIKTQQWAAISVRNDYLEAGWYECLLQTPRGDESAHFCQAHACKISVPVCRKKLCQKGDNFNINHMQSYDLADNFYYARNLHRITKRRRKRINYCSSNLQELLSKALIQDQISQDTVDIVEETAGHNCPQDTRVVVGFDIDVEDSCDNV